LFDDDGVLKLADFGLAINMNEEAAVTRAGGGAGVVERVLGGDGGGGDVSQG
jgi:hypothetical protein